MKRLIVLVPVLCLLTGTAFAAGVSLRYRMDPNNGPPFYVSGQNVKFAVGSRSASLPRFHSRQPLLGQARLGRGGNTAFRFALDESRGTRKGYDTLYVDSNHNGSLADEKPLKGERRRQQLLFGPFRLLVPIDGKQVLYHARLQKYDYRPGTYTLEGLGYYTGALPFGDKQYRVAVVDCNCNGLYDDTMKGYFDEGSMGDVFLVDLDGNGEFDNNSMFPKEVCFAGKRVALDGKYYDLRLSPDGSTVAVAPSQAPLGTLRADFASFMLMLSGEGSIFPIESSTGTAQVPRGSYKAVGWSVTRKTENGEKWEMQGISEGKNAKAATVAVGESECAFAPDLTITARPAANVASGGQVQFTLSFETALGQRLVTLEGNGKRPAEPTLKILDETGAEVANLKFEYG